MRGQDSAKGESTAATDAPQKFWSWDGPPQGRGKTLGKGASDTHRNWGISAISPEWGSWGLEATLQLPSHNPTSRSISICIHQESHLEEYTFTEYIPMRLNIL